MVSKEEKDKLKSGKAEGAKAEFVETASFHCGVEGIYLFKIRFRCTKRLFFLGRRSRS
jgi:hypothetical protein